MLHFVTRGRSDNLPVLFLHAGSFTSRMWFSAVDQLPEINAIFPDLPGHGGSIHRMLSTLEQAADDLAELVERELGGEPVDLVGLSFGAYVGLTFMIRHPHLVDRACLSGCHAGDMPNPRLMKLMLYLMSPLTRFAWFYEKSGKSMGLKDTSICLDPDGRPNVSPATLRTIARLVVDFDIRATLPDIRIPTLVLAGEKEHATILNSLEIFEAHMPNCEAGIVAGLGHAWCAEDEALFVRTIRCWLSGQRLPTEVLLKDASF